MLAGLVSMTARGAAGYPAPLAFLTCLLSYAFVYGLWKCRLWGGGDAKLVLALFLLLSPVYPPLIFIVWYALCLAVILLIKHGVYWRGRAVYRASRRGPMSAEDVASLQERGSGKPMGPALLASYVLSVGLLTVI